MNRLVVENVGVVADADASRVSVSDLVIEGERIKEIAPPRTAAAADGRVIDGSGLIAFPGLINGHFHSGEHFLKGLIENRPLETFVCFVRPPRPIALSPRQIYLRTMIGAIDALVSGTTTVVDDVNEPLADEQFDAIVQAYTDIGIRAFIGSAMTDTPYFRSVPYFDQLPDNIKHELAGVEPPDAAANLKRARELGERLHPKAGRVGYILAPSAPQRCSDDFLRVTRRIADDLDLPTIIHVHETAAQATHGLRLYGQSMVGHLADIRFLGARTSIVHGVWLTPGDLDHLARCGTSLQHTPWSNLCLGSGVSPQREALDRGVNVSIGSDGSGSTLSLNILNVMGAAAGLGKLAGDDPSRWLTAAEVFRAATVGAAAALGFEGDIGVIRPGSYADLSFFRVASPSFMPLADPIRQLVYAERGAGLAMVIVDGQVVVRDGACTRVDGPSLLAEIAEVYAALAPSIHGHMNDANRIAEQYEAVRRRAIGDALPSDMFPARLQSGCTR